MCFVLFTPYMARFLQELARFWPDFAKIGPVALVKSNSLLYPFNYLYLTCFLAFTHVVLVIMSQHGPESGPILQEWAQYWVS